VAEPAFLAEPDHPLVSYLALSTSQQHFVGQRVVYLARTLAEFFSGTDHAFEFNQPLPMIPVASRVQHLAQSALA
jgi:hypothetical protein